VLRLADETTVASLEAGERVAHTGPRQPDESLSEFITRSRAELDAKRKRTSEPEPVFIHPDGTPFGLEDLTQSDVVLSDAAQRVNAACDSIDIFEVYDTFVGKYREEVRGRTDSVKAICPEHDENNPSSWFGVGRDGDWLLCCGHGGGGRGSGWNKFGLAALAWGVPNSASNFWELKKRLARELRGAEYQTIERPTASGPTASAAEPSAASSVGSEPEPNDWEMKVEERKYRRLVELEADHRARQERSRGLFTPPTFVDDLESELRAPDPEIEWTIEGLHGVGGNTTITAGFKVGKTTFVSNLVKVLADQEKFLGSHDVRALSGRIAYWNFEVEQAQMKRNFRDLGIKKASNIFHLPLRGHHLDLMDDAAYAWALSEMKRQEIEVWVLDPFSGAYYGDENDNSQINAFTKRLDEFKREAGIIDLFMPVHTGRYVEEGNERARGGAKVDDWTDNRWVLAKHSDTGDRYFKAEGRRVEQQERELHYRREDNSLTYSAFAGTRRQKAGHVIKGHVLDFIDAHPGCSGRDIESAVGGKADTVRAAVRELVAHLDVEVRPGPRNAKLHYRYGSAPIGGGS
jgi:hypothetical protein